MGDWRKGPPGRASSTIGAWAAALLIVVGLGVLFIVVYFAIFGLKLDARW
jgi:hypothetical protein